MCELPGCTQELARKDRTMVMPNDDEMKCTLPEPHAWSYHAWYFLIECATLFKVIHFVALGQCHGTSTQARDHKTCDDWGLVSCLNVYTSL